MGFRLEDWTDKKFYNRIEWLMAFAENAAKKSHDEETKVGACLVHLDGSTPIAIGYNGFVRGAKDKDLPRTRPEKYKFVVHAEANLIANCARLGISMKGCELYCTLSPCIHCMRLLFQCGITKVYAKELYKDFDEIKEMADIQIEVKQLDNGYFLLTYKEAK
jgi:dCMP deaminase